jgi:hypothetical protein
MPDSSPTLGHALYTGMCLQNMNTCIPAALCLPSTQGQGPEAEDVLTLGPAVLLKPPSIAPAWTSQTRLLARKRGTQELGRDQPPSVPLLGHVVRLFITLDPRPKARGCKMLVLSPARALDTQAPAIHTPTPIPLHRTEAAVPGAPTPEQLRAYQRPTQL